MHTSSESENNMNIHEQWSKEIVWKGSTRRWPKQNLSATKMKLHAVSVDIIPLHSWLSCLTSWSAAFRAALSSSTSLSLQSHVHVATQLWCTVTITGTAPLHPFSIHLWLWLHWFWTMTNRHVRRRSIGGRVVLSKIIESVSHDLHSLATPSAWPGQKQCQPKSWSTEAAGSAYRNDEWFESACANSRACTRLP